MAGASVVEGLFENWKLKLLSLAGALALYALGHGGMDAKRTMVVNLEALLPEREDKVLAEPLPTNVRVTLRGSSAEIDNLRAAALGLQVDLRAGRSGHVTFDPTMVHGPPNVRFEALEFDPPGIDVAWEDRIRREVPVQVSVVGTPAAGYVVMGAPVAEPTKVTVTGPASDVMALADVKVSAFDVRGLSEGSYPRQLAVVGLPPRMKTEPSAVFVTAIIVRETIARHFDMLTVAVVGHPLAKATPSKVTVRLTCPPETFRALRAEQVLPRAEVTSRDPNGSVSVPVLVTVNGCEAEVTPPTVVVKW